MPNDPKWRTIARISKQPISLVLATYCHLLVDASRNVTRGHATVTAEDLASALDVTEEQIDMILHAMEGRVLSGMRLLGWEKRQPKREDQGDENTGAKSAAQRKAEQRLREKQSQEHTEKQQCHELSRNVTLDTDKDKDKDTDKEYIEPKGSLSPSAPIVPVKKSKSVEVAEKPESVSDEVWSDFKKLRQAKKAPVTQTALDGISREATKAGLTLEQGLSTCCELGWTGLKSSWLKDRQTQGKRVAEPRNAPTFAERDREAGMARWEEMTGQVHPERIQPLTVIDVTEQTRRIA